MASGRSASCAGLVHPFLVDGFASPKERWEAIASEVELYLHNPQENDPPEALIWLHRVRKYGLPWPGGFVDQPYYFMQDLEAAEIGEARYEQAREVNRKLRQMWEAQWRGEGEQ